MTEPKLRSHPHHQSGTYARLSRMGLLRRGGQYDWRMRSETSVDDLSDFLSEPVVATLATYGSDGRARLSPVWHEWADGGFNVTIDKGDIKARHLDRDRRASLVVYSNDSPYKGVEIRTDAIVTSDGAVEAVARLAHRYLNEEQAKRFLSLTSWEPLLVRLEPGELRHWHYSGY